MIPKAIWSSMMIIPFPNSTINTHFLQSTFILLFQKNNTSLSIHVICPEVWLQTPSHYTCVWFSGVQTPSGMVFKALNKNHRQREGPSGNHMRRHTCAHSKKTCCRQHSVDVGTLIRFSAKRGACDSASGKPENMVIRLQS